MIASRIEGRIRFRHPALQSRELLEAVTGQLAAIPGITGLEANPRTGSLLVTHDATIATDDLVAMAEALALTQSQAPAQPDRPASRASRARLKRRTQKIGMATALTATLATGLADIKAAHLLAALAFTGLAAWHVTAYRRRFLA